MKKATALILSLLMIGLISAIALVVARLSISEIQMAASSAESVQAYYTAEAGLEVGLAKWRWNRDVQVSKEFVKSDPATHPTETTGTPIEQWRSEVADERYKLKIWYKAPIAGEDFDNIDAPGNPTLTKDQAFEFDVRDLSSITLKYEIDPGSISHAQAGVEVAKFNGVTRAWDTQLYNNNTVPGNVEARTGGILISQLTNFDLIRIKPWGCNIRYTISPGAGNKIDSGKTTIESTGAYRNTKRKLVAEIDRRSGTILAVYDFVLYAGKEIKQ